MGIALILVMGMLAFIINIGLFVKAKINLQNAVDAAAFAGAATQSRQLTNIANVNWEMRNTYKEWMFKYYILGQMGLVKGNNNLSDAALASPNVSFLLRTPAVAEWLHLLVLINTMFLQFAFTTIHRQTSALFTLFQEFLVFRQLVLLVFQKFMKLLLTNL